MRLPASHIFGNPIRTKGKAFRDVAVSQWQPEADSTTATDTEAQMVKQECKHHCNNWLVVA